MRGINLPAYSLHRHQLKLMNLAKPLVTALALIAVACTRAEKAEPGPANRAQPEHTTPPAPSAPAPMAPTAVASLTEVTDPSQVCMVNNQYMGRPQIPTTVEGKTYYGCCPMCKGRLEKEASARTAKDPVSGRDVDKAVAVIGKQENGDVLYFESRQTLAAYRAN
jgi:YHS domain-containing protein